MKMTGNIVLGGTTSVVQFDGVLEVTCIAGYRPNGNTNYKCVGPDDLFPNFDFTCVKISKLKTLNMLFIVCLLSRRKQWRLNF